MKNSINKVLLLVSLVLILIVLLVTYWSTGNVSEDDYYERIAYPDAPISTDTVLRAMTYNIGYLSGMINNQPTKREVGFFKKNLKHAKRII